MIGRAVAAEFAKTFTTRLWWVLLLILVGYVGLASAGLAFALSLTPTGDTPDGPADLSAVIAPLAYSMVTASGFVFPVIFGALMITGEARHRTLTPTFLVTPSRWVVLVAKLVVGGVIGATYGVAGLITTVGLGAAILAATGGDTQLDDADTWWMFARIVLAMLLWGLVGVGLGVLIPSQIGSIVAILAFTQFVEPIARTAAALIDWLGEVAKFLPGAAGDALVGSSFFQVIQAGGAGLEWWQGGLVLLGYAVLFTAIGWATFWRRDVT